MAIYYFAIDHDEVHTAPEEGIELRDINAAWNEATTVCGEMLRDLNGELALGTDWKLTVSDGAHKPLFELQLTSRRLK